MHIPKIIILTLLICFGFASLPSARTWYVEKDGSGDYTIIQQAVDAASPGDTIRIGTGRFTENAPLTVGWTEDVYIAIQTDNLTLIGAGPDVTIIGPDEPEYVPPEMPKGIVGYYISYVEISNLTVENVRDGIYRSDGGLTLLSIIIRGCDLGLISLTEGGMQIEGCSFLDNSGIGLMTYIPARDVEVKDSYFANNGTGLSFNQTENAYVYNCQLQNCIVGIQIHSYSNGGVFNCKFDNIQNVAITIAIASNAVVEGNVITGGYRNIDITTLSHITGTGNILSGGQIVTIRNSHSTHDFHGNHILNNGGYSVVLETFLNPPDVILDLSENYWGTMDTDTIEEWIRDGHDDPDIHAFVDFEPISDFILDVDTPEAYHTDILKVIPNPFNPQTELAYTLAQDGLIRLTIYDLLGRKITVLVDEHRLAGPGSVTWDGRDKNGSAVASGVYIARLETKSGVNTQKLVLAR